MRLDEDIERYKDKKIGVIMGGLSSEREISLRSGENVYNSLVKMGLSAVKIDADRDLVNTLARAGIDIAFNILHGKYGEDGAVQGVLEYLNIPYTGSGILGSAIGMDKIISKKIFIMNGIPVPPFVCIDSSYPLDCLGKIKSEIGFPFVLKPSMEGSSIGVSLIKDESDYRARIGSHMGKYPDSYAEKYITGKEITVGVAGMGDRVIVLPILSPRSGNEFYDFEAKYTKGLTEFELPAKISPETGDLVRGYCKKAFREMKLCGVARFDAIIDPEGNPFFLEVNTLPGMTETSDIPAMARSAGCYDELMVMILDSSIKQDS
ncbi:MAG: D-alanine--D-alanine ligase [Brevinematales bacterium]|jgi:D-alanine-D-alanine ligase